MTGPTVEEYLGRLKHRVENGNIWIDASAANLLPFLRRLRQLGVERISSITGMDTGSGIEVIYHLIHGKNTINVRIALPRDGCEVQSITGIYPGANLFERELHEMLGVEIRNHPNLKKLFLSDESPKTPLRKS